MAVSTDASANRGLQGQITSTVFTVLALIFVILRLVTRVGIVHNGGADDWMIAVSLLFSIAMTVLIYQQISHGMGRHFATLALDEYSEMLKPFWASIVMYNLALTCTKVSILLQYLRVFVNQPMRRICWVVMGVIVVYGLWTFFASVFTCWPIPYFWNKTIENGKCLNLMGYWFSNAALNIASDILLLALPMPVLKSLKLPKKQKLGLVLVFGLGGLVCIISVLRLHALYVISVSTDVTWDNVQAATWSSVEVNIGIICASLPALKALLNRISPRLLNNSTYNSRRTVDGGNPRSEGGRNHSNARSGYGGSHGTGSLRGQPSGMTICEGDGYALRELEKGQRHSDEEEGVSPNGSAEGRIKVLTVLSQEVENRSETSSQRNLVWKECEGGARSS